MTKERAPGRLRVGRAGAGPSTCESVPHLYTARLVKGHAESEIRLPAAVTVARDNREYDVAAASPTRAGRADSERGGFTICHDFRRFSQSSSGTSARAQGRPSARATALPDRKSVRSMLVRVNLSPASRP